jgi:hypothetical protein
MGIWRHLPYPEQTLPLFFGGNMDTDSDAFKLLVILIVAMMIYPLKCWMDWYFRDSFEHPWGIPRHERRKTMMDRIAPRSDNRIDR